MARFLKCEGSNLPIRPQGDQDELRNWYDHSSLCLVAKRWSCTWRLIKGNIEARGAVSFISDQYLCVNDIPHFPFVFVHNNSNVQHISLFFPDRKTNKCVAIILSIIIYGGFRVCGGLILHSVSFVKNAYGGAEKKHLGSGCPRSKWGFPNTLLDCNCTYASCGILRILVVCNGKGKVILQNVL